MPLLKNEKHERFAQGIIKHTDRQLIMEEAGLTYSPSYYSHLKNLPTIQARILELQKSVQSENIMKLEERLETLSEFARDNTASKRLRITALAELHRQSGDDVSRVGVDINADTLNVIRHVDIALPNKSKSVENAPLEIEDAPLDDIMSEMDEILKEPVIIESEPNKQPVSTPVTNETLETLETPNETQEEDEEDWLL